MIAYIKSNVDFATKDYMEFDEYSFAEDIEFAEKSEITVLRQPNITDDDYVICKDGGKLLFFGICENYSSASNANYTISLKQIENLFDREIFVGNEALIQSTGIEDFIVSEITSNWVDSGDSLLDKSYITVSAATHTQIHASIDAENNVYNLKTFLGNAKEYYGIFLRFTMEDDELIISVEKDAAGALPIDTDVEDVADYEETYDIDVLAKLNVKWKQPDTIEDGVVTDVGPTVSRTYYLKADRTITTDADDPDRAQGIIRSFYIETETEDEMYQEVINQFMANSYAHKITFNLYKQSNVYPPAYYYVGRPATIKTKSGIKTSIITGMSYSSESAFISFIFGKLKITLIEKLRDRR